MLSLTILLQYELERINSSIKLNANNQNLIKLNLDYWANVQMNNKLITIHKLIESEKNNISFYDREIYVGEINNVELKTTAYIVDYWLNKDITIWELKNKYSGINISPRYLQMINLSVNELLETQWLQLYQQIKANEINFDIKLFIEIQNNFYKLYPNFSHCFLYFNDTIELNNHTFKTPIIFCQNVSSLIFSTKSYVISKDIYPSKESILLKTYRIAKVIKKINEYLPIDFIETKNPLQK